MIELKSSTFGRSNVEHRNKALFSNWDWEKLIKMIRHAACEMKNFVSSIRFFGRH